jgi:hypothetical protein
MDIPAQGRYHMITIGLLREFLKAFFDFFLLGGALFLRR